MAETIGDRVESFRSSFAGLRPFILVMSLVIGVSSGGGVIARSESIGPGILLGAAVIPLAAGAAYALMALLLGLAIRVFPVHVHRGGLRSYNATGVYTSMSWSEMSAVKEVDYAGLRYYEISSSWTGKKILIPYFLADPATFNARIARLVSSSHVLARALGENKKARPGRASPRSPLP